MMKNQAAAALTFLGFSEIEALIYCFLLQESPATGYRVSHAIGKPTANTYKAIAALAQRGAIIVDDSKSRLCRAVPYEELLDRLARDFGAHRQEASDALSKIRRSPGDDRVYQLTTVDQVLERARAMLGAAEQAALLDLFPHALSLLAGELEATARRGVSVAVRAYAPAAVKGVSLYISGEAQRILSTWPGEQLSIAVDGDQFLTALLSRDAQGVHQAIWSNSTYLSCLQYNALHVELELTELARKGSRRGTLGPLSLTRLRPPGFVKLNERYGEVASRPAVKKTRAR
jgi:HTH-type transcriptional regulator, sugar sensing transcriptional regulator